MQISTLNQQCGILVPFRTYPYPTRCNNLPVIDRKPRMHYLVCQHAIATEKIEPCAWNYQLESVIFDEKCGFEGTFVCPHRVCTQLRMGKKQTGVEEHTPMKQCVFVPDLEWDRFTDPGEFDPNERDRQRYLEAEIQAMLAKERKREAKAKQRQTQFPPTAASGRPARVGPKAKKAPAHVEDDDTGGSSEESDEDTSDEHEAQGEPAPRRDTLANVPETGPLTPYTGKGKAPILPYDPVRDAVSDSEGDYDIGGLPIDATPIAIEGAITAPQRQDDRPRNPSSSSGYSTAIEELDPNFPSLSRQVSQKRAESKASNQPPSSPAPASKVQVQKATKETKPLPSGGAADQGAGGSGGDMYERVKLRRSKDSRVKYEALEDFNETLSDHDESSAEEVVRGKTVGRKKVSELRPKGSYWSR